MIISPSGSCNLHEQQDYDWHNDIKVNVKKKTFSIGAYEYVEGDIDKPQARIVTEISTANAQFTRINNFPSQAIIYDIFLSCFIDISLSDKVKEDIKSISDKNPSNLLKKLIGSSDINNVIEVFNQAYKDRESLADARLMPYIFGQHPSALKSSVGKGNWARLSKLNKNQLYFIFCPENVNNISYYEGNLRLILDCIDKYSNEFNPNLKLISPLHNDVAKCLLLNVIKSKVSIDSEGVNSAKIKIRDCHNLMRGREEWFNPEWSIKRVTEKHDYWSSRQTYTTMGVGPNDVFYIPEYFKKNAAKQKDKYPDVDYKFLNTSKDYLEEGQKMNHCIASYAKDAKYGKYVTVNLTQYGKTATVGYREKSRDVYKLEQMCSQRNGSNYTPQMENFAKLLDDKPIIATITPNIKDGKINKTDLIGKFVALALGIAIVGTVIMAIRSSI